MLSLLFALQILTLVLVGGLLALSFWLFHKTRKIHHATFQILDDVAIARREAEVLFAQLQALAALEKKLNLADALPPMRGWACSPDFLLTVADAVLTRRPVTVLECSSGVSTVVTARCLQMNGEGHVFSLEHDAEYARKTSELLGRYGLADWATVLHAPLVAKSGEGPWYDETSIPADLGPIELVVVDGPPQDTAPLARLPALPRLLSRMAQAAIVILDDAAREAETEIVKLWVAHTPEFRARFLPHEKGCVILERESLNS